MKQKSILFIFILFLIFALNTREVKALEQDPDLIVIYQNEEIEVNLEELLSISNYTLIKHNVNYHKCGMYQATYINEQHELINKKVLVTNDNLITFDEVILDKPSSTIKDMIIKDGTKYFLIEQNVNEDIVYYLIKQDYQETKEYQINKEAKQLFIKNNIIGVISEANTNINLLLFDLDLNLINEYVYGGNGYEVFNCLTIDEENNYLYLAGNTTSYYNYFSGCFDNDGYILKIDLTTMNVVKSYISKKQGFDTFLSIAIFGEELVCIEQVTGNDLGCYLTKYNFNLVQTNEIFLQSNPDINSLIKVDNNKLYLAISENNPSLLVDGNYLYIFDYKFNLIKKKSFMSDNNHLYLKDLQIYEDHTEILCQAYDEDGNLDYSVIINIYDYYKKYYILRNTMAEKIYDNDVYGNNFNFDICKFNYYELQIDYGSLAEFKNQSVETTHLNYQNQVYNGIEDLSIVPDSENSIGNFNAVIGFKTNDFYYYFPYTFYLEDEANVENNTVYGVGFIVKFNGIGYLNGEYIKTGHQINNEGSYILVITGVDEEYHYLFTVSDLANHKEIIEEDNYDYTVETQTIKSNASNFIETTSDNNKNVTIDKANYWLLTIPVMLVAFGFLIRIRFVR